MAAVNTVYKANWVLTTNIDRQTIFETPQRLHMREVFCEGRALKVTDLLIYHCTYKDQNGVDVDTDCHLRVTGFSKTPKHGWMPDFSAFCMPHPSSPTFNLTGVTSTKDLQKGLKDHGYTPKGHATTELEVYCGKGYLGTYKDVCGAYKYWTKILGNRFPFVRHS